MVQHMSCDFSKNTAFFAEVQILQDDRCRYFLPKQSQRMLNSFNNIIQLFVLFMMTQTASLNESYSRFKRETSDLPYKCRMFLSLLIGFHDEQTATQVTKTIRKNYEPFTSAFKHLSAIERVHLISKAIAYTKARLNGSRPPPDGPNIHEIETTCETRSSFYGVSYWQKRNFKFQYNVGVVKLSTGKKLEIVQLKNYLVRQSASEKHTLVLEAVQSYLPENRQKISIRFGNKSIFQEIFGNVRAASQELVHRRLEALLGEQAHESQRFQENACKGLTFLSQRNINDYLDSKQGMIKKLKNKAANTGSVYSKNCFNIKNSIQSSKYYYLQYLLSSNLTTLEAAKESINILGKNNIPNRFYCENLESFAQNIAAKYFKITTDTLECQSVMIVQTVEREGRLTRIMKSAQSTHVGVTVPFILMELQKGKDNIYRFSLQGIIKLNSKTRNKNREAVKLLLSMVSPADVLSPINSTTNTKSPPLESSSNNYETSPVRKKSKSNRQRFGEMNFAPSINQVARKGEERDSSEGNEQQEFYSIENEQMEGEVQDALNNYSSKNVNIPTHDQNQELQNEPKLETQKINFLNVKPFLNPLKECELKYIQKNFLQEDWQRLPKGGVVCIDEATIDQQKKIFKLICKQFGSKLFKMQGLSFSLPVQICRPESALISMARNVSYAPLLFENHSTYTPLERIKKTTILEISMALLALSTKTPFNPVLGETYQGSINGCPIFMEQISHHPPITYLYLQGRGYKIYGSISPQIHVRLNYVKGVNNTWLTVDFENGDKLQFTIPTMIVNNMLFGERNIYFESTNYVYDPKNGLLAEVVFNAANKGFFNKQNPDIVNADIYQVTPGFIEAFQAQKRAVSPKKDDKNKLLASISGEWNGKIMINSEIIFDFEKQLPILLVNFSHPLESDSTYRQDSINLMKRCMQRAQEQKQKLQHTQRIDKKLRQQFSKHRK